MTLKKLDKNDYETCNDGTSQILDIGPTTARCWGYKSSRVKIVLANILCVVTGGFLWLLMRWYPLYKAGLCFRREYLNTANLVLVQDKSGRITICPVHDEPLRFFEYQMQRFTWDERSNGFILLVGKSGTLNELISTAEPVNRTQRDVRLRIHGPNSMTVEVKPYFKLLVDEVLNPFYIFEAASVILWIFDEYYHFAICVIILSGSSIIISLYQGKKQSIKFKEMVSSMDGEYVSIIDESGRTQVIKSVDLIPGDILYIPPQGCSMPCDALLLTGTCIVNEAVLTGESTPVTKIPATQVDEEYDPNSVHAKHTLYGGTKIIQTRYYHHDKVTALVARTGSMTAKGQLVHSIMYPRPFGFDFYREAVKIVVALFIIAAVGLTYSVVIFLERGATLMVILLRSLDIMTIVVPPALPAAMTVGTLYSKSRLKSKGIYCIEPPRINVAGKVKLVCFDKTGTLTEEGLSVWGILTSKNGSLVDIEEKPCSLHFLSPVLHAMATCHSLTKIDGNLCGDPLDLSMFHSIEWELEEAGPETNRYDQLAPTVVKPGKCQFVNFTGIESPGQSLKVPLEIGIVRQFHFNSNIQCMSVITRTLGARHMTVYTKGAPEKVLSMCQPTSKNVTITLSYYTSAGYRVIALAYKTMPRKFNWLQAQKVTREEVENNLEFLGMLIMKNTLKPESAPVIRQLQHARIKCLMLTGDNMLTAVSVSRNCGLIAPTTPLAQVMVCQSPKTVKLRPLHSSSDHTEMDASYAYAVDGSTWTEICEHFPGLAPQVATRCVVFARMSPSQKAHVVETLQTLDYIVAMVGDGANDCGALKTAHIGISLSSAEASIAAPFTSTTPDITCVPRLITEGRCSLVTNFGVFNFLALFGLIQFCSVLILYLEGMEMGTMQFLYVDLAVATSLTLVTGRIKPCSKMHHVRPLSSLLSLSNLIPLCLQIVLAFLIQFWGLMLLKAELWYRHTEPAIGDDYVVIGWENTTVFIISCYQFVILAVAYSKGEPHRQPIYKNVWFTTVVVALAAFTTYLFFTPNEEITQFFELMDFTYDDTFIFRLKIILLVIFNLILSLAIEHTVAQSVWFKWCINKIRRKKVYKNKYKIFETYRLSSKGWDPLSV